MSKAKINLILFLTFAIGIYIVLYWPIEGSELSTKGIIRDVLKSVGISFLVTYISDWFIRSFDSLTKAK